MTTAAFTRRLRKRKLKSEINVVPYIDVMLVLLIIFMITAPLLNLGVDINLPQVERARASRPRRIRWWSASMRTGGYTLKLPDASKKSVNAAELDAEGAGLDQGQSDAGGVRGRRWQGQLRHGLRRRWCCCSRPASSRWA